MSLGKAQTFFDSTIVTNGDTIAAYLFATNRLTSATVNSNESLRTIAALQDGAGTAITSTLISAKQSLDVNVAGFSASSLHVDGTVADGATDADNPVKIGYQALSTLTATTTGKRVNGVSDLYRRVYTNNTPNIGQLTQTVTVGVAAAILVPTAPLAGRRKITIQNNSAKLIYIGGATVTADTAATGGVQVAAHGGTYELEVGDNIVLYGIGAGAGLSVAVQEVA